MIVAASFPRKLKYSKGEKDWLVPKKTFKITNGAHSQMTSCDQIKQITFVNTVPQILWKVRHLNWFPGRVLCIILNSELDRNKHRIRELCSWKPPGWNTDESPFESQVNILHFRTPSSQLQNTTESSVTNVFDIHISLMYNQSKIFNTKSSGCVQKYLFEKYKVKGQFITLHVNWFAIMMKVKNACFGAYSYSAGSQYGKLHQSFLTMSRLLCQVPGAKMGNCVKHT